MSQKLNDFVNTYYQPNTAQKYERLESLRQWLLIGVISGVYATLFFVLILSGETEINVYRWEIELPVLLVISTGLSVLFFGLHRAVKRKQQSMDYSASKYVKYLLAKTINVYLSDKDDLDTIATHLKEFYIEVSGDGNYITKFTNKRRSTVLYIESEQALLSYINHLRNSDPVEHSELEEVLEELVEIIEKRYNNKLIGIKEGIEPVETDRPSYISLLISSISEYEINNWYMISIGIMISSLVSLAVFFFINQELGMLLAIILLSGIQIYSLK